MQGEFKVTERYLTMSQLCSALKQQRVKEVFGSGTACMVSPIGHIVYQGEVRRGATHSMKICAKQYKVRLSYVIFDMKIFTYMKIRSSGVSLRISEI